MTHWLDDLAQTMARGISRRRVLGQLGAGFATVLVAALAPEAVRAGGSKKARNQDAEQLKTAAARESDNQKKGKAGSKTGSNSDCARWCHQAFRGKERGECTSAAARGEGACYRCGPRAPRDSIPTCSAGRTLDPRTCTCTCSQTCSSPKVIDQNCQCVCPSTCGIDRVQDPQTCACVCQETCPSPKVPGPSGCSCVCPSTCQSDQVQDPDTCACTSAGGTCGDWESCGGSSDCILAQTADQRTFCVKRSTACDGLRSCDTNSDCGQDETCLVETCCKSAKAGVCAPASAACSSSSATVATAAVGSGSTIGGSKR